MPTIVQQAAHTEPELTALRDHTADIVRATNAVAKLRAADLMLLKLAVRGFGVSLPSVIH